MAGIYIHVPFCKSKCNYCDFYSGTQFSLIEDYVLSLCGELCLRSDYLKGELIQTIYFGGGTPSILTLAQLERILIQIRLVHTVSKSVEITFECNPEDLNPDYACGLKNLGINRISIGIQSFNENLLNFLGRSHSPSRAKEAVACVKESGIKNISVDFIYAIPGLTDEILNKTLEEAISLEVTHISLYNLTISEKTKLYWKMKNEHIPEMDEKVAVNQYNQIYDFLVLNGFLHYEVSNYAVDGFQSKHNLSYWSGIPYLGVGPSAHSFDGISRQWNSSILSKYINSIKTGQVLFEIEYLSEQDRYNEYIITNLRTYKGLSINYIKDNFSDSTVNHFLEQMSSLHRKGYFVLKEDRYCPDRSSLIKADYLSTYLMV